MSASPWLRNNIENYERVALDVASSADKREQFSDAGYHRAMASAYRNVLTLISMEDDAERRSSFDGKAEIDRHVMPEIAERPCSFHQNLPDEIAGDMS